MHELALEDAALAVALLEVWVGELYEEAAGRVQEGAGRMVT